MSALMTSTPSIGSSSRGLRRAPTTSTSAESTSVAAETGQRPAKKGTTPSTTSSRYFTTTGARCISESPAR